MTLVLPEVRPWVWDWLKPFQREAIAKAVGRRDLSLWHTTGAGKTVSSIIWGVSEPGDTLVVTRAGARIQFSDEIKRFTTVRPFIMFPESTTNYIRRAVDQEGETLASYLASENRHVVVVAWSGFNDDALYETLKAYKPHSVIYDEIHTIKSHKRWKRHLNEHGKATYSRLQTQAARAHFFSPKASRRLGLTATPIANRRRDLWGQLSLVEPDGRWGKYWDFATRYLAAYESTYGWNDTGESNTAELNQRLALCTHVVTQDQIAHMMPPVRRMLTRLSEDDLGPADGEAKAAVKYAARVMGGGSGLEGTDASKELAEARLMLASVRKNPYVIRTALDCMAAGQKVIVFTGRRKDVEYLGERVKAKALDTWGVWAAHGGSPAEERELIRREFMNWKGPCCLIGTGDAWGEAMSLDDADRLLIQLLPWTWRQIKQWEGRVRRLSMNRPCIIEYVIALGTFDERIQSVVLKKLPDVEAVVPESQVTEVRETLQGGSDDDLIEGLLEGLKEGRIDDSTR